MSALAFSSSSSSPPNEMPERFRPVILVVDDDPAFLEEMIDHIARAGVRVKGCQSPEEAFSIVVFEKPALVFLDVLMPRFSGIRLAHLILGLDHRTMIVLMTGAEDIYYETLKTDLPIMDLFKKPFSWRLMDPYLEVYACGANGAV